MALSTSQCLADLRPYTSIEIADMLSPASLHDLCDAADATIGDGGGVGWVKQPERDTMERYWRGVMTVPERHLLIARLDGVICGAAQLVEPSRYNEAQSFSATLLTAFIAPWARGHGAGRKLVETTEKLAIELGYKILSLDMRETQTVAVHLFESMGYRKWGMNPSYALIENKVIAGYHYTKTISPLFVPEKVTA